MLSRATLAATGLHGPLRASLRGVYRSASAAQQTSLALPVRGAVTLWAILFVWMGTGCILNARRCHRLHCYISGPAFLLGAAVLGLLAVGLVVLEAHALNNIVGITLLAALLSFIPEIWKKYA